MNPIGNEQYPRDEVAVCLSPTRWQSGLSSYARL